MEEKKQDQSNERNTAAEVSIGTDTNRNSKHLQSSTASSSHSISELQFNDVTSDCPQFFRRAVENILRTDVDIDSSLVFFPINTRVRLA